MPRFNFTNITAQSKVNIADIMNNFNRIEQLAALTSELTELNTTLRNLINSKEASLRQVATTSPASFNAETVLPANSFST